MALVDDVGVPLLVVVGLVAETVMLCVGVIVDSDKVVDTVVGVGVVVEVVVEGLDEIVVGVSVMVVVSLVITVLLALEVVGVVVEE